MNLPSERRIHVACLCAAWCRLCDDYVLVFKAGFEALRQQAPAASRHWIDIEDEADLVGDFDVTSFPTLVVVVDGELRFAGALTPQAQTLHRVLRAALDGHAGGQRADPEAAAFAARLLSRTGDGP